MKKKSLEDRMRNYERIATSSLIPTLPVIIRIDGKGFSKFTKHFAKPYDKAMAEAMLTTTRRLAENVPHTKCAYTQSDEISLVLICEPRQEPWFGFRKEKIVSIVASMATLYFNEALASYVSNVIVTAENEQLLKEYDKAVTKGALFDARAFNLPDYEVDNYLIWRQNDCNRNSLEALARSVASAKALKNKKAADMHELLYKHGINWAKQPKHFKDGTYFTRQVVLKPGYNPITKELIAVERHLWQPTPERPKIY